MTWVAEIICVGVFALGTIWVLRHGAAVAVPAATGLWLVVFTFGAYGRDRFLSADDMAMWVLFGWIACVAYYGIVVLMRRVVLQAVAKERAG